MTIINDSLNADDLAKSIEALSDEIGRMRKKGPLSFQDVQKTVSSLTRAQLVLNELERIEIRDRGVSMDMAERFSILDGRLRAIRYDLYQDLTNRKTDATDASGTMPVTGADEDGSDAYHIAG